MSGSLLGFVAFALVLGAGYAWFKRAMAVALPENRRGFVAVFATGLALAIAAFAQGAGWIGGVAAGLAAFGGTFFLFSVAISAQKGGAGAFHVGSPVPEFTAPDDNGTEVQLSSLSGQPLLLKFFRGHW